MTAVAVNVAVNMRRRMPWPPFTQTVAARRPSRWHRDLIAIDTGRAGDEFDVWIEHVVPRRARNM